MTVYFDSDGSFCCDFSKGCSNLNWCDHRAQAIKKNKDIEPLHEYLRDPEDSWLINLPMLPDAGIFFPITIAGQDDSDFYYVSFTYTPDYLKSFHGDLGLLMPEDGIGSLVRSSWQMVESRSGNDFNTMKCKQASHGIREQSSFAGAIGAGGTSKFKEMWFLGMEGACSFCVEPWRDPDDSNFGINPDSVPSGRGRR